MTSKRGPSKPHNAIGMAIPDFIAGLETVWQTSERYWVENP